MRIYRWTNASPSWTEFTYITQTDFRRAYINYVDDYYFVGAAYNNSVAIYGKVGEIRMAVNQTAFSDNTDYDARPIMHHVNLGKNIIAKRVISRGGVGTTDIGINGDAQHVLSEGVMMQAQKDSGFVSIRDQMLKYSDDAIPQGKKLSAKVTIDKETAADSTVVQGLLLNYSKK